MDRSSSMLNATPRRQQPMRSCRIATELNAGKVKRGVSRTSKQKETSACPDKRIKIEMLSLPNELMFKIFVLLPADILYKIMRYVSCHWYKIIHDPFFIKAHLLRANDGLFIRYTYPYNAYYVDMSTRDVTVTKINFHEFSRKVWGSCDGLLLLSDSEDRKILHVMNPITKQRVTLPPIPSEWRLCGSYFTLARACSTGEYKVVINYYCTTNKATYCAIVTVGKKDLTWRTVDTEHVSAPERRILRFRPRSAGGYVFWALKIFPNLLTLDVETEVVRKFLVPKPSKGALNIFYQALGDSLGCVFWCYTKFIFEVLVLADPKSGKWENLYKFDLNAERDMIRSTMYKDTSPPRNLDLVPIAWVNNGEVVVFIASATGTNYIAHNVKTGETYSFGIDTLCKNMGAPFWFAHVNSLVSLEP